MKTPWLDEQLIFPPVASADPNGLLAIGGDLEPERLLLAYRSGIFPWYSEGQPILWWSPDPRFVLFPRQLKISNSMQQVLRKDLFNFTVDRDFHRVIEACQKIKRVGQEDTWITPDMIEAYETLHEMGYAHSVEVWQDQTLVGGLYGISLGKLFFGESMFSKVANASKAGFIRLVRELEHKDFRLIDCQVYTDHLKSLGAVMIPRDEFLKILGEGLAGPAMVGHWREWLSL